MSLATPIVIGNWKMNGLRADGLARVRALRAREAVALRAGTLGICPPATLLAPIQPALVGSAILLGGQDCSSEASGAHTGDLGAAMLVDAGCRSVIVGHSERRHGHGETNHLVRAKAAAAQAAGLIPIVCIGETEAEWQAGRTLEVLDGQLEGSLPEAASATNLIVAYEPVWAIGTGRSPGDDDIVRIHAHVRRGSPRWSRTAPRWVCCMAARSRPAMPVGSWRWPRSMARWSVAPALMPRNSLPSTRRGSRPVADLARARRAGSRSIRKPYIPKFM